MTSTAVGVASDITCQVAEYLRQGNLYRLLSGQSATLKHTHVYTHPRRLGEREREGVGGGEDKSCVCKYLTKTASLGGNCVLSPSDKGIR